MTSWRDDTSSQAQADLDALLDAALGSAEELLGGEGSLRPLALAVTAEGELEHQEKGAPVLVIAAPLTRTAGAVSIDGVRAPRGRARVWS